MIPLRKMVPLLILLVLGVGAAQAATWTTIDVPGASRTGVTGINNTGDVVGYFLDSADVQHGFLLRAGNFITIDVPGATSTGAAGVNDFRDIVGYFSDESGVSHGFLFDGQTFTVLDFPLATSTAALGINDDGEIVGEYVDNQPHGHGFRWSGGSFTSIDVPGADYTNASGISDKGFIVGYYATHGKLQSFFLNAQGSFRFFEPNGFATAVNDHKIVVGYRQHSALGFRFDLKTDLPKKMRFPGSDLTFCNGINNAGQIVGIYDDDGVTFHGFLRTK